MRYRSTLNLLQLRAGKIVNLGTVFKNFITRDFSIHSSMPYDFIVFDRCQPTRQSLPILQAVFFPLISIVKPTDELITNLAMNLAMNVQ
jgi:hypothetical protein